MFEDYAYCMTILQHYLSCKQRIVQTIYEIECIQFLCLIACMTTVQHFLSCKQNMSRQDMMLQKPHWWMLLMTNAQTLGERRTERTMKHAVTHH